MKMRLNNWLRSLIRGAEKEGYEITHPQHDLRQLKKDTRRVAKITRRAMKAKQRRER